MGDARQHFSGEISAALLAELQSSAEKEGRDIQLLIDEAIAAFIEKRKNPSVRDHVMATYEATHKDFDKVYKKLAE